ncbi:MAG: FkbM family methyltransferase [Bacteroidetes Order II. Incertae sedis bacterium]|nr:FkbM family methyltransferase [Bacteroidetes Order II. bacterium]
MRQFFYKLLSVYAKKFHALKIVGKPIKDSRKYLFYEKNQHLTFWFNMEVNYEPKIKAIIKSYLSPSDLVFDIGANIGQYAMSFSEWVPKGAVVALEPDYKNFAFLQLNAALNHCENVTCLNIGIGREDTSMIFYRDTETGGRAGSFLKEMVGAHYKGHKMDVAVKSLDSVIQDYGMPNFVKIDVEGFELEVLKGLSFVLDRCIFMIEVRSETKKEVFAYFVEKGYVCYWIDEGEELIKSVNEVPDFANLLFVKA